MKNKLYMSLFAVAVSGCITVSAVGKDGQGIDNTFWGKTVATSKTPNWSSIVKHDKPGTLGAARSASIRLGASSSTYAPSQEEDFLRKIAEKLNELADDLSRLRQENPILFNKYFDKTRAFKVPMFTKAAAEDTEYDSESEEDSSADEHEDNQ